jgi:hypothetical protein
VFTNRSQFLNAPGFYSGETSTAESLLRNIYAYLQITIYPSKDGSHRQHESQGHEVHTGAGNREKSRAFYGSRLFITEFTKVPHLSLSSTRQIHLDSNMTP